MESRNVDDSEEKSIEEDSIKLTRFLPEEVWQAVVQKLKEDDFENCINSSLFFWKLGKDEKRVELFSNVVSIMAPLFEERKFEIQVPKNEVQEMVEPKGVFDENELYANWDGKETAYMSTRMWKTGVLNCRLVCSTWNKAVEKCYESREMTGIPEFVQHLSPRSPLLTMYIKWKRRYFTFSLFSKLINTLPFFEHFEQSHSRISEAGPKNPFFGRRVHIDVGFQSFWRERLEHRYTQFIRMLQLFGDQIWYCTLTICEMEESPPKFASELQLILGLMPNLKYLKVQPSNGPNENLPMNMFAQSPVPKLNKLELLVLRNVGSSIATELVQKNAHVPFLNITRTDGIDINVGSLLSNLQGYSTTLSTSGDRMLARFGAQWNLNKVVIYPTQYLQASQLFSLLEDIDRAQTLTEVHLEDPFTRDVDTVLAQSKTLRLNLPNVRRLSISSYCVCFMDFALPMKGTLEHLTIDESSFWVPIPTNKSWLKVKSEETIELLGFMQNLHSSNIWNIFPKLKTIKVLCFDYETEMLFTKDGSKLVFKGPRSG